MLGKIVSISLVVFITSGLCLTVGSMLARWEENSGRQYLNRSGSRSRSLRLFDHIAEILWVINVVSAIIFVISFLFGVL